MAEEESRVKGYLCSSLGRMIMDKNDKEAKIKIAKEKLAEVMEAEFKKSLREFKKSKREEVEAKVAKGLNFSSVEEYRSTIRNCFVGESL